MSLNPRSRLQRRFEAVAARATWCVLPPAAVIVAEFPRSGGTWIAKVLGNALDLPVPQHSPIPIAMPAIQHGHLLPHSARSKAARCLVVRDGRDVYVSLLFHMRSIDQGAAFTQAAPRIVQQFLASEDPSTEAVVEALPSFLEWQLESPTYARKNWADYNAAWLDSGVSVARYEDFVASPEGALMALLEDLLRPQKREVVNLAVARHDFELVSGRKPGQEEASSFLRSGTAGGWRQYFSDGAHDVYQRYCGAVATQLGFDEVAR